MERFSGIVKWFDDRKGFGFLERDDSGESVFVHFRNIIGLPGQRTLNPGEKATWVMGEDSRGRPMAVDVLVENPIPGGNRDRVWE